MVQTYNEIVKSNQIIEEMVNKKVNELQEFSKQLKELEALMFETSVMVDDHFVTIYSE